MRFEKDGERVIILMPGDTFPEQDDFNRATLVIAVDGLRAKVLKNRASKRKEYDPRN